jgi:uncharacterized protein (DUF305 family)
MNRFHLGVLAALAATILAACGTDQDATPADTTAVTVQGEATANEVDIDFAAGMIPHHQQAMDMAELAADRAHHPQVRELADRIMAAQGPEIRQLEGWLGDWDAGHGAGHGMGEGRHGMMSDADMSALRDATGAEFDRMFLEMMIEHHKGALTMAQRHQQQGAHHGARGMSQAITETQQQEIDEMEGLLDDLD